MAPRLLALLFLVAAALRPLPSAAHGSVTPEDDVCIIRIGFYEAHFKMYLPRTRGHKDYCEDIPGVGETIFVMEYEHSGLGDVPIDFRIIRNVTGNGIFTSLEDVEALGNLDAITVVHHPAAVQPDVFTFLYDFAEQGEFVGIVAVQNPENGKVYTAVFPFEVGFAGFGWWPWFALLAILLQVNYLVMSGRVARWRRERRMRKFVVVSGAGSA